MPEQRVLIVDHEKLVRWSLRKKCEEWAWRPRRGSKKRPVQEAGQRQKT